MPLNRPEPSAAQRHETARECLFCLARELLQELEEQPLELKQQQDGGLEQRLETVELLHPAPRYPAPRLLRQRSCLNVELEEQEQEVRVLLSPRHETVELLLLQG